jgi:zinc protease
VGKRVSVKRLLGSLVTAACFLNLAGCVPPMGIVAPPVASRADEVASFKPEAPERWKLANGLTVLFARDRELPIVRGKLFLRGGALWAPEQMPVGAVGAMGEQMRSGGAGDLSADALDRELEKLAASISSSFGAEFGGVGFGGLSSDFERVCGIFSDVVLRPRFEHERLSLFKGQALEGIRRRVDDPGTVTRIAFSQLLYGDSVYGRVSKEQDVRALRREHLTALHSHFIVPDGAILVITGDVEKERVAAVVEKAFGAWKPRGSLLPPPPPVTHQPKPGIYFIELPFSQASVEFGQLGVKRLSPDWPAIDVFNEVFGASGFGSRLMNKVRTELGLSYGVGGGISPGPVRGANYVFLQTKAESVAPAIEESIKVLVSMQREVPTEEEMQEKKAAIRNSYVFNFDSLDDIALRAAQLELLEYPTDYDQTFLAKVGAVTPEQVREVASTRWSPESFIIVVVGNEAAYSALKNASEGADSPLKLFALQKLGFDSAIVVQ